MRILAVCLAEEGSAISHIRGGGQQMTLGCPGSRFFPEILSRRGLRMHAIADTRLLPVR